MATIRQRLAASRSGAPMTLKGARVRVPDLALPAEFMLVLDDKSSLKRCSKVVWRRGVLVGLKFVYL
jgi:hypothetical protein